MVDTETKNYFEDLVVRERKIFNGDMERYMGALKEGFQHDVKLIAEMVSSKPDKEEVRKIVQEEIQPLKTDIEIIKEEVSTINKELRQHNKRLTTLENVLV